MVVGRERVRWSFRGGVHDSTRIVIERPDQPFHAPAKVTVMCFPEGQDAVGLSI